MKISEVMEKTGLTKRAIRYYEDEGLLSPSINNDNNYRDYSLDDMDRLIKISLLRQLDLGISDIKGLIVEPSSINKILKNHLERIDENINRLQTSKHIIRGIIESSGISDANDFTERLRNLRNLMELEDKQKYGYIKRQLQRIFPGTYGRMFTLHFSPFLNEPIDTKEKEAAWIEIINYLDEAEDIKLPEEYEYAFSNVPDEMFESFSEKNNENIKKLINSSAEELENYKKEILESIKSMQENKEFKEARLKMWQLNMPVRNQLTESGYYDKFVKNLRILSKDYNKYQEVLHRLNDELGLKYDESGNIVVDK
jgi:DNA-binding transcriptional MerR regulator